MQAGRDSNFGNTFRGSIENSGQVDWLKTLRQTAMTAFTERGVPTKRDEEWKYTDVAVIANTSWELGEATEIPCSKGINFSNGILDTSSVPTEFPEGVTVLSFDDAQDNEVFKDNLTKVLSHDFNAFAALNQAFAKEGLFVHVARDTKLEQPLRITFESSSESASFPRILFVGESGSEAEIVEVYTRSEETKNLTNSVAEIALAPNARLKHTRVQRESHQAIHVGITKARLERDSVYNNTNINLGAAIFRHDTILEFTDENGEAWVDGLYILEDGQHSDTHSQIHHKVKNCVSHQNYKGILDGKSRAVFNGKVFVHENASGTDAEQSNKNLLLSNDARVDTKPQLEIFNDDVKCAHGATVGQLEEEEMFYLLSRGLNENLARNLLTYGFAEEIINKLDIEDIKKDLDEAVLNRLHAKL